MNNNLDINLNPTFHSIASTTRSNQHRESFPYELYKIKPKKLQRDGVEMKVVMVLVMEMMMMMMITMKSSSMTVMMVTVSPLREGISSTDFSLQESFSLSGVFHLAAAAEYFSGRSPRLRVLGRMKYTKRHWQRWARAASPCPGAT